MIDKANEILETLTDTIKIESYNELQECFKLNIHRFKFDMGGSVKSIDPDSFTDGFHTLKDLQTRVELLVKLADFIDYVGALQGALIE